MKQKSKTTRLLSLLLLSGMLASVPAVRTEAAVITSNATDKIAVVFNESTAYSAGDYVIYDGELYICTDDIQGAWNAAEGNFMQITKNHALGTQEDLSASYETSKDPSEEKSLMAFAANAWQKIKGFLGIGVKDEETDVNQYKNASVSAKLNFLQQQNQQLDQNVSNLQGWITQSFQSVSNGKSILAAAITDKKGTAGPQDSFQQFAQAIRDLAQIQYNDGHNAGHNAGLKTGYDQGYDAGIAFADGRVNENSASYLQGAASGNLQVWEADIKISNTGPDKEEDFFEMVREGEAVTYSFHKVFEGKTITAAYIETAYSSPYSYYTAKGMYAQVGDNQYMSFENNDQNYSMGVTKNSISWGSITLNTSNNLAHQKLKLKVVYR